MWTACALLAEEAPDGMWSGWPWIRLGPASRFQIGKVLITPFTVEKPKTVSNLLKGSQVPAF